MKESSKEDLIEAVIFHIKDDFYWGDSQAVEELLGFCPVENLIKYLPEDQWKQFKHLKKLKDNYDTES
jgi:hypothetical protein